jgi:hypothetical protein
MMHDTYYGNDQVHSVNGSGMNITHIGKSIIPTPLCNLALNNVLHVPSTQNNLISVHRFTLDNDTFIEFHPFFFLIEDQKTRRVLLCGQCKGDLYPLPSSASKFRKLVFSAIKIPLDQWHYRLGHRSRNIVPRVISKYNLPCSHIDSSDPSICDASTCAKAHQLPYSVSSSSTSVPLELLYSDVWGPAIDSFDRKKYHVSFIDDYSKFTWIYFFAISLRCLIFFLNFNSMLSA